MKDILEKNNLNLEERILLSKLKREEIWRITKFRWDWETKAMSQILENCFNEYVEYYNCGVQYRMIRTEDIEKYIANSTVKFIEKEYENP